MNEYRNKSQKQLREPFHLSFFLVQLFEHSAECVLYTAFIAFSVKGALKSSFLLVAFYETCFLYYFNTCVKKNCFAAETVIGTVLQVVAEDIPARCVVDRVLSSRFIHGEEVAGLFKDRADGNIFIRHNERIRSVGILRYLNSTVIDRSAGAVISVIGSNADCHLHACAFSGTCCRNRTVRYIPVYRNFVTDSDAETYRIFTIHCAEVFIGFRIEFNIRIPLIQ